ncbi:hypothetical protein [Enhygromyxa salina]|uniref:hypothetical protein n=1 Tax=Enhygromyxa salina TaxID=215803 RepID=UPI000D093202|nr:hypothetical protein [Enhygromyxa salina]
MATITGVVVASDVRAGQLDDLDLPVGTVVVDQDTLDQAGAFDGEFVFAGGQKERDGVDAAIETSVAALSPMLRKLGRKRLQESNPVFASLSISVDGDSAEIAFDNDSHEAKLDGTPIKAKSKDGEKVKVSHRMRGTKLTQLLDGVGGDRLNEFRLSDDGKRVTVKVKIISGHLPVPVEYRLTYKRK